MCERENEKIVFRQWWQSNRLIGMRSKWMSMKCEKKNTFHVKWRARFISDRIKNLMHRYTKNWRSVLYYLLKSPAATIFQNVILSRKKTQTTTTNQPKTHTRHFHERWFHTDCCCSILGYSLSVSQLLSLCAKPFNI